MNDIIFVIGFTIFMLGVSIGGAVMLLMVASYHQYRHPWRRHERERRREDIRIRQWSPPKSLPPTPRPESSRRQA